MNRYDMDSYICLWTGTGVVEYHHPGRLPPVFLYPKLKKYFSFFRIMSYYVCVIKFFIKMKLPKHHEAKEFVVVVL